MSKQQAFFMSPWEKFQQDHPEKFERKKRSSTSRKSSPKVYDCSTCKLHENCRSPKMKRFGKGKKKILVVGLCPGRVEDRVGIPLMGPSGGLTKKSFRYVGLDLDEDCERTNIVQCYPGMDKNGKDKNPTNNQIKCCSSRLERDIIEAEPELIICLGGPAINAVLKLQHLKKFYPGQTHGKVFPCHGRNSWVGCSYHPSFFLHRKGKKDMCPDDEIIFGYDLANIISYLDEPLPQPLTTEGNKCITDASEVIEILESFCHSKDITFYDYEATALTPWEEGADLLSFSITNTVESAYFVPLNLSYDDGKKVFNIEEQAMILGALKRFLASDTPKSIQNVNMEETWNRMFIGQPMNHCIHDTMIAAHVINNHSDTTSLAFQVYEMVGYEYKKMIDVKKLSSEPLEKICNYNSWDSRYGLMSCLRQRRILQERGRLAEFYDLLHEGSKALVGLRENGTKIDVPFMTELGKDYQEERELRVLEMRLLSGVKQYEEESGNVFNPDSATKHLQRIIYGIYKEKIYKETPTRLGSTDEEALNLILKKTKNDEVKQLINSLFRYRKCGSLTKRVANYKKVMDSNHFVRPSFNLNMADTYRSSASDPSIQNVFKRDKELIVFRKCIVPASEREVATVPIFEVHDSITFDNEARVDKVKFTIDQVTNVMCRKRFDWQKNIPLEVEWEAGWNWYSMYPLQIFGSDIYVKISKDKKVLLDEFIAEGRAKGKTRILLEVDYSGMETRLIAMISGDPELSRQVIAGQKWNEDHPEGGINPHDLHRRWGGKVLQKVLEEVTSDDRYRGKNGLVFPGFYGSKDKSIARTFSEIPVEHVIKVMKEFWEEYHYVREWQKKTIHDYLKDGFVEAPNGWRRLGPLSINQLHNNIVQGTAFHCLLGSLIDIEKLFTSVK